MTINVTAHYKHQAAGLPVWPYMKCFSFIPKLKQAQLKARDEQKSQEEKREEEPEKLENIFQFTRCESFHLVIQMRFVLCEQMSLPRLLYQHQLIRFQHAARASTASQVQPPSSGPVQLCCVGERGCLSPSRNNRQTLHHSMLRNNIFLLHKHINMRTHFECQHVFGHY